MPNRDIVVMGASAGGVATLIPIVRGFPADLEAAVFVVLHLAPYGRSALAEILGREAALPVVAANDAMPVRAGTVYVATPDRHLVVEDGTVGPRAGPRVNAHRPSVDVLFRSVAHVYGPRVIGVVLTGALDDGTAGLLAIKAAGGLAVVQSPQDARHKGMPLSALANVPVDHCVPSAEIAPLLTRLVHTEAAPPSRAPDADELAREARIDVFDEAAAEEEVDRLGRASGMTCPTCHGALWDREDGELLQFRCRVGHAFSPDSLVASHGAQLDDALWTAYRALLENAALARRMAKRAAERGDLDSVRRYEGHAERAKARASVIREVLLANAPGAGSD